MNKKYLLCFGIIIVLLLVLFMISINMGSIKVTNLQLFRGLFIKYDENVAIIYDLRFPRIIIALLSGAALAVSGVLFQGVLKNPIVDPGIIGISAGSNFVAVIIMTFFPSLFFYITVFAFIGGLIACGMVYHFSWKSGLSPLKIVLFGVAVNSIFVGLAQAFDVISAGNKTVASQIATANISMKTWDDAKLLAVYVMIGLILSLTTLNKCNLLALDDKSIRSLGINVKLLRVMISLVAVLLASITTAVLGMVSFIGLIVPHLGRLLIGNDHRFLVPFSMLLGAFIMLLADTVGRTIAYPYEISASIIMAVIGGPFFIILLRRSDNTYGS